MPFSASHLKGAASVMGRYGDDLAKTVFKGNKVLEMAGEMAEAGKFQEAVEEFYRMMRQTGVKIVTDDAYVGQALRGTRVSNVEGEIIEEIIVSKDFFTQDMPTQLLDLTHKYKSLIMQRMGLSRAGEGMRQLLTLDEALLRAMEKGGAPQGIVQEYLFQTEIKLDLFMKKMRVQ